MSDISLTQGHIVPTAIAYNGQDFFVSNLDTFPIKDGSSKVMKITPLGNLTTVYIGFTTVLGPASDGFHENHVHVDLAERRSGYRICQWAVRDASDLVPLPRERPSDAPPREQ